MSPDPKRCSPLLVTLGKYLRDRWGGQDLGCYVPRPVVGGSKPSDHASGAAHDWRYQDPGMGRSRMLNEAMPWLINNSLELGIQAVHDYVGCRIWRPPAQSGRPAQVSPDCGWRQQTPGSQMGQPWALWLHLAVLDTRWSDTRTIDQMLAGGGTGPTPSPPPLEDDDTMLRAAKNKDTGGTFVLGDGKSAQTMDGVDGTEAALRVAGGVVDVATKKIVYSWNNVGAIAGGDVKKYVGNY